MNTNSPHHSAIIAQTAQRVKVLLDKPDLQCTGHDWWHTYRVWQMAIHIATHEPVAANLFIVEMAALLHDVDDWKFRSQKGSAVEEWLEHCAVESGIAVSIAAIVENTSFKGAHTPTELLSIEGQMVQDADRLDALGAIGIARAFAYGGHKAREIYNPEIAPQLHASAAAYQKSHSPTINHFYEKLLLLKDRLNTSTAKNIAAQRHEYMEQFLKQFFSEWEFTKT